jgi:hypothetical protein
MDRVNNKAHLTTKPEAKIRKAVLRNAQHPFYLSPATPADWPSVMEFAQLMNPKTYVIHYLDFDDLQGKLTNANQASFQNRRSAAVLRPKQPERVLEETRGFKQVGRGKSAKTMGNCVRGTPFLHVNCQYCSFLKSKPFATSSLLK